MSMKHNPNLLAGPMGRRGGMGPQTLNLQTEGRPAPAKPPGGFRIEHRIGVQAPADVVWEVIHDLSRWTEWNPTYPKAEGAVRIGETLNLTLALPGQPQQTLKPVVLDWVPNEQLHWRLSMLGGLIRTLRYIEIQAVSESGCIVDNGELFGGLMGASLGRRVRPAVRRGFEAMNEALKTRAESIWTERSGS